MGNNNNIEHAYTDAERTGAIELRFRDMPRPAPYAAVAAGIGRPGLSRDAVKRLLWGTVTGYPGKNPKAARLPPPAWPQGRELCREGLPWHKAERDALRAALGGKGQERQPPVDVAYIAQVLARSEASVGAQWRRQNEDPLGRGGGFGLVG